MAKVTEDNNGLFRLELTPDEALHFATPELSRELAGLREQVHDQTEKLATRDRTIEGYNKIMTGQAARIADLEHALGNERQASALLQDCLNAARKEASDRIGNGIPTFEEMRSLFKELGVAACERLARRNFPMEWRPIATAPKDGTRILLSWGNGPAEVGSYRLGAWWGGGGAFCATMTHWQPLPEPPK